MITDFFLIRQIFLVIAIVLDVILVGLVFFKNPKSATHRIFALLGLVSLVWLISMEISLRPTSPEYTLFWIRATLLPKLYLFHSPALVWL